MRRRHVSLYVEWADNADTDAVRTLLLRNGACMTGMDEETDAIRKHGTESRHANTIFRFYLDRMKPVYELLSAVAMLPGVYSVSELQ